MVDTPEDTTQASVEPETPREQSETPQTSVEATGDDEVKKPSRRDRRISKLTARLAAEREQNESLRKQLDDISSKVDALSTPKPTRPQRDNYESDEDFFEAMADYRFDTKYKPAPPAPPPPDPELERRSNEFIESSEDVVKGFRKIVANARFPLTGHSWNEIMDMEDDGARVFAHLNEHPQDAFRIAQLSSRNQTIELEKLADSLDRKKSSAPPPIKPVSGNDNPEVDESKLSTAEWIARRNKKVHGY